MKLVDVWEEIIIATQPDMYVGRRKSVLSVCKLDDSSLSFLKKAYMDLSPTQNLWRGDRSPCSYHSRNEARVQIMGGI